VGGLGGGEGSVTVGAAVGAAVGVWAAEWMVAMLAPSTVTPNSFETAGCLASSSSARAEIAASASESARIVTLTFTDAALTCRLILLRAMPVAVDSACLKLSC